MKVLSLFLSSKQQQLKAAQTPPDTRVYCIGDIHGRDDLLTIMHDRILDDACNYSGRMMVLYLGDYIDRGLNSKGVIERLISEPLPNFERIFLRGNHEQLLLSFLEMPQSGSSWLNYGGQATLFSYGVKMQGMALKKAHLVDAHRQLQTLMPPTHRQFIESTQMMHHEGDYCFVHAGIRPSVPLKRQKEEDMLWIRDEFIGSKRQHEKIVIHGHTVTKEPELLSNRIGIDTGAFCSGRLSCLVLEGKERRLINAQLAR